MGGGTVTEQMDQREIESILKDLMGRRITRRDALKYAGVGAGTLGLSAFLAACGVEGTQTQPTPTGTAPPSLSPLPPKAGVVQVANWPLYIDLEDGESVTLDGFKQRTGIDITYKEDISDNDEFFGTDLRQQLSAGQATGWDIIVMTDWMIAKLVRLGWVEPLHQEVLPNCTANLDDKFRNLYHDPGNAYSYPWAAGITGIGYNTKLTGRPITRIEDLFDPAFKGHVGMFSEMRDTINFVLLNMGMDPTKATLDQVEQGVQKLTDQRDAGIVRAYYGNDYIDPLSTGDLWITMAWSGDVNFLKVDNPDLAFVVPEEGGNRWSDNMCIPKGAEHPTDAHEWMNYVYDPEVATGITEWVWYESPVKQVRGMIREDAAEDESLLAVAESTIVWPDAAVLAKTYPYKNLSADEEEAWHDLFDPLIQG
jgi:spermidine/putrescine transport system substrate-binding protein